MSAVEKIVVVTKKTALEELIERFNTRDQARFYIEHMGGRFDEYQSAHDTYKRSVMLLKESMPSGSRTQWIDRSFLPTFTFGEADLVVTLGPDGLVVNTAKYLHSQPLLAFNPDPARVDGVLVLFPIEAAPGALAEAKAGDIANAPTSLGIKQITMARAELNDGQSILGVNDLFIGQKTHVSARYQIQFERRTENQSSSGIIVSTGAGSTGWFRSVVTGAAGVMGELARWKKASEAKENYRFDWEAKHLMFSVREPFISKTSGAEIIFGKIREDHPLVVVSQMPQNGVIFSDGVEEDFLPFNSGSIATIGLAAQRLNLIVPVSHRDAPAHWSAGPQAGSAQVTRQRLRRHNAARSEA
jgi:NAD kinase